MVAASSNKDRSRPPSSVMKLPSADSDSRSWPADSEAQPPSSTGTAAGDRTLAEMNMLRRSLRTAGTHRSYALPDDEEEVPDLERSDSIVSSIVSAAGDSFSAGSAEALRAAALAVAPGWQFSAARFSKPGAAAHPLAWPPQTALPAQIAEVPSLSRGVADARGPVGTSAGQRSC